MQFVDTHCHIQSCTGAAIGEKGTRRLWEKAGYPAPKTLIKAAVEAGVTRMVCVGCDLPDSRLAVDFVSKHPECYASVGIHPHEAKKYVGSGVLAADELAEFAALATRDRVVAVGECGLDYYYEHSGPAAQAQVLRFQIELALKHDLPLIFHVRDAFDDFWPVLDSYDGVRGVLHSFTDSTANMEMAVARGLYIGVNGIATFTKSQEQRDMYKIIPLSRILLETDAPFLTPSPYRGKICEPYHTSVTAEFLAEHRGISLNELATSTTANAQELFRLE